MNTYKPTIGLEIHVALNTEEKLFSNSTNLFSSNEHSYFDVGFPGVLPKVNKEPVNMAILLAHQIRAKINLQSSFDRKHYFYPDLPLGYQITQQYNPIMSGGSLAGVEFHHAHLECDAAKTVKGDFGEVQIDISRCASPLLEIVTMPCIHSASEAKNFVRELYQLVCFLGICDGEIESGSFRVDVSISVSETETL